MSDVVAVGIDPGAKETGFVIRFRALCPRAFVVARDDTSQVLSPAYVSDLLEAVDEIKTEAKMLADVNGSPWIVAVEDVTAPTGWNAAGQRAPIAPVYAMSCAAVLGLVLATCRGAVIVSPGGNGSGPRLMYPKQLWGADEPKGTGWRRHLRSAWDVAGAGLMLDARSRAAPGV